MRDLGQHLSLHQRPLRRTSAVSTQSLGTLLVCRNQQSCSSPFELRYRAAYTFTIWRRRMLEFGNEVPYCAEFVNPSLKRGREHEVVDLFGETESILQTARAPVQSHLGICRAKMKPCVALRRF